MMPLTFFYETGFVDGLVIGALAVLIIFTLINIKRKD